MNLQEYINEKPIEEGLFGDSYLVSKKADKLILKLKKRKDLIDNNKEASEEDKKLSRAIGRTIPVMDNFRKYFIKLEKELESVDDEERKKLIEAKYDDIKVLFINQLYKIMESVSYKPSIMVASLIAWIIFTLVTPFTNWLLIPTYITLRSISKHKKAITNRSFSKELDRLMEELESKKRLQYRSYKNKEVGINF